MKRIFLVYCAMFLAIASFAQEGIRFESATWNDILAKAKAANKLVFIDVYTSWCGPCKMMAAETFPQKTVGDVFNANFINYKIDAEKGEGIQIAKQFDVRAFPTYLFVNGDGELVYRVVGYMKAEPFLKEAAIAIQEKNDPMPFLQWEKEYERGKRDKDFLLAYMKKRALLKLPSAEIAEELFPLLTKEELADGELLSTIVYFDPAIQFVPDGKVYNYVLNHAKELDASGTVKYPLGIMEAGINNYFQKNIIPNRQEKLLPVLIASQKRLMTASNADMADMVLKEKELTYQYYDGVKNTTKLALAVIDFVEHGIMKLDIVGKKKANAEGYKAFMKPYLDSAKDSLADPMFGMMKRMKKGESMMQVSYRLRSAAETVYNNFSDQEILNIAAGWAKQANEWFPHFSNAAVYAGLLFKTGNQQKALAIMQKASEDSFLEQAPDIRKLVLENVEIMKQGKLPAGLWKVEMPETVVTR